MCSRMRQPLGLFIRAGFLLRRYLDFSHPRTALFYQRTFQPRGSALPALTAGSAYRRGLGLG